MKSVIFGCTFSIFFIEHPNISWLSGFGACRLNGKSLICLWHVSTRLFMLSSLRQRPIFILSAVFCFKKCFCSAFLHSGKVILVSHHSGRLELSGRKTVKIINISIYKSLLHSPACLPRSLVFISKHSAEIVLFFRSISPSPLAINCCIDCARDAFWLLAAPQALRPDPAHGDRKWRNSKQAPAREIVTCAIEIRIGKFQFLLSSALRLLDFSVGFD